MGISYEVVSIELVPLEGVGKQHLLQTKPEVEPLVQDALLEENQNDVHMNINKVDPSVMEELMNKWGEWEYQPLANMDFQPVDVVHLPSIHVLTSRKLGARGRKGNANLSGEGILPPKGI